MISEQASLPGYSLLRSSPAFVVLAIAIGCANNFADPDLWMHITVGERILRTGHIPMHDLYSYSAVGLPWRNHEWLAQVIFAVSYDALGVFGLKLVKLVCTAITVVAVAVGLSRTAASLAVQRLVLLAAAAGLMDEIQFRPQLFTFAMLSILIAMLATEIYQGSARLWPLVPAFALWANLHGGYVAGLAALAIVSGVVAVGEFLAERKITRAWSIAAVTVGCAAATLLNPLGMGLWSNVAHSVSDPVVKEFIGDWVPLPTWLAYNWRVSGLDEIQDVVPLGLFAGFLVALVLSPTPRDAPLVVVASFFIGAAFYSSRNVALALISLSIPFAHHLELARQRRRSSNQDRYAKVGPSAVFATAAALMLVLVAGECSGRLKTWKPVPSGALAFMKTHRLSGNILNDLGWGAYLAWHGTPRSRIFVDGRCELVYPDSMLREYAGFLYGLPGGARILERFPHDFVLIKPGTGAYRIVAADPRWKLVYQDAVAALFAKAAAPVATAGGRRSIAEPSWFP